MPPESYDYLQEIAILEARQAKEHHFNLDLDANSLEHQHYQRNNKDPLSDLDTSDEIESTYERLGREGYWIPKMIKKTSTVVLFAKPNGGKTLLTIAALIEEIKKGNIKGEDIIYCNEDDGLNDLEQKRKIFKSYGIRLMSSSMKQISTQQLQFNLHQLAVAGHLRDKLVVFDTLTKFCDLNTSEVADFLRFTRLINTQGGTCLLLSHANKHEDDDGWPIFKGLQDLEDNCDAMYSMRALTDKEKLVQLVHMRRGKDRGGMDKEFFFEFEKSEILGYEHMIRSFRFVDESKKIKIDKENAAKRRIWDFEDEFLFLRNVLRGQGEKSQSDILADRQDPELNPNSVGRNRVAKAIKVLRGLAINVRVDRASNNTKWISWREEVESLES